MPAEGNCAHVNVNDQFWNRYQKLLRETVIPYQHEVLYDRVPGVEPSYAVHNFQVASGEKQGVFGGMVFQDSDIAKWLEAVGYSLAYHPDPDLEDKADKIIAYIAKAQQPDGYVNTYYILNGLGDRFTNLCDCHELYCLGHFIEAAVAYYQGTGKRVLLDVVCKFADLVDALFGHEEGKLRGYPGHQEIELALVRLYDVTGEARYLNLARYFLEERGREPNYFLEEWERRGRTRQRNNSNPPTLSYHQAHMPVREQKVAVGHAVRAVYMYTGMAMVAKKTGDTELLEACRVLFGNIAEKQLYITGGIGQTSLGEAFSFDYDLPNDTVYSETCAAIGLIFFARQMLENEVKGKYADVMERALYNTVLAGMSMDGSHFFYVNPLEVWPEASEKSPIRRHVLPERPGWFRCACCPPNISRLLLSLDKYIYTYNESGIYVHLYVGGEAAVPVCGSTVKINQSTSYPWDGKVRLTVQAESAASFTLALRVPGWCKSPSVTVNGKETDISSLMDGYLYISQEWGREDVIELDFPMEVRFIRSNARVRSNAGKVAVTRGPLVYCAEEKDNGENLSLLSVDTNIETTEIFDYSLSGGGAVTVTAAGYRDSDEGEDLYIDVPFSPKSGAKIKLIPYFMWGNRGKGEMSVWLRASQ